MEKMKTAGSRLVAVVLAAAMAVCMAAACAVCLAPQQADAAANQSVLDQRSGVFKFNWGIDGREYARGSAFLINEDTIVTAYHCVMPSSFELDYFGLSRQDVLDRSTYTVNVSGGFQVSATLEKVSEEQDTAILKLDQKLNNVKALTMRNSSTVDASEQVFALGFPASADQNAIITFTSNDVAIFDGTVTKPEAQMSYTDNSYADRSGNFLITTCRMDGGTSGGPMVDADGYVVGVCVASGGGYYYASASDVLISALETMSYDFSVIGDSSHNPGPSRTTYTLDFSKLNSAIGKAEAVDKSMFTEASYAKLQDALADAQDALKTELADNTDKDAYDKAQAKVDDATKALDEARDNLEEAPQGPDAMLIAIIVIAAVVVIAIIVALILIMRNRKKKQQEASTVAAAAASPVVSGATASQPALNSGASASWTKPGAAPASEPEVSETTILDDEGNDTILLFQAASGGSLTRMSNNEQIPINSAEFVIGRQRSKVNYCLEGNSAIGRMHARFIVRDGNTYCIDNGAKNGTYVNGVKCRPGEEIQLKSGDIITLADEKFKYNA